MIEYRTISIDSPWYERGGGKIKRGADRHYPLLHTPDIPGVIMNAPCWHPAWSCHLYLWATNNHLPDALWVVEQLGFRYITIITWAKDRIGLGQYYRGQTEHLLFAVRGQTMLPRPENRGTTLVTARRRRHSQKPQEAYTQIEQVSPGPYLEMFARNERSGWGVWGTLTAGSSETTWIERCPTMEEIELELLLAKPGSRLIGITP